MRKGFTLVEMAIVLLIIGIIIGGIIAGRSMIETAKIQRLIKDLSQYEAAINKFKEAYQYLPGDSPDFTPPGTPNNILDYGLAGGGNPCAGSLGNFEPNQFYAHLSQAEMLDKDYVSYSPIVCGGAHSNDWYATADITAPYTEPGAAAVAMGFPAKYAILPIKIDRTSVLKFQLILNPAYVIPMETKMGPTISNFWGTGQCIPLSGFSPVSCTNSNAAYGLIYWNLKNL